MGEHREVNAICGEVELIGVLVHEYLLIGAHIQTLQERKAGRNPLKLVLRRLRVQVELSGAGR